MSSSSCKAGHSSRSCARAASPEEISCRTCCTGAVSSRLVGVRWQGQRSANQLTSEPEHQQRAGHVPEPRTRAAWSAPGWADCCNSASTPSSACTWRCHTQARARPLYLLSAGGLGHPHVKRTGRAWWPSARLCPPAGWPWSAAAPAWPASARRRPPPRARSGNPAPWPLHTGATPAALSWARCPCGPPAWPLCTPARPLSLLCPHTEVDRLGGPGRTIAAVPTNAISLLPAHRVRAGLWSSSAPAGSWLTWAGSHVQLRVDGSEEGAAPLQAGQAETEGSGVC